MIDLLALAHDVCGIAPERAHICAWCGCGLGSDPERQVAIAHRTGIVSHGICEPCAEELERGTLQCPDCVGGRTYHYERDGTPGPDEPCTSCRGTGVTPCAT